MEAIMIYALGCNENIKTVPETDDVSWFAAFISFFCARPSSPVVQLVHSQNGTQKRCSIASLQEESFQMVKGLLKKEGIRWTFFEHHASVVQSWKNTVSQWNSDALHWPFSQTFEWLSSCSTFIRWLQTTFFLSHTVGVTRSLGYSAELSVRGRP